VADNDEPKDPISDAKTIDALLETSGQMAIDSMKRHVGLANNAMKRFHPSGTLHNFSILTQSLSTRFLSRYRYTSLNVLSSIKPSSSMISQCSKRPMYAST
jgi:diphthamide biosynthesis methyltransferase